jgi:hypothetical protein
MLLSEYPYTATDDNVCQYNSAAGLVMTLPGSTDAQGHNDYYQVDGENNGSVNMMKGLDLMPNEVSIHASSKVF